MTAALVLLESFELTEVSHELSCVAGTGFECSFNRSTVINSPGSRISSNQNDSIDLLSLENSKQIKFLPSSISKVFPSLIVINAYNCSIELITTTNFANLTKLKDLWLGLNRITQLPGDTFNGLLSLERIGLSESHKNFSVALTRQVLFFKVSIG